jgi:hypothetical protein
LPRFLDEAGGGRVVDGGSCRVFDDLPDTEGILRLLEVGRWYDEGEDAIFVSIVRRDEVLEARGVVTVGKGGGGMRAASELAAAIAREADERCMLSRLGNAGGMSPSASVPSSVASRVSSGVEIDTVNCGST